MTKRNNFKTKQSSEFFLRTHCEKPFNVKIDFEKMKSGVEEKWFI